MRLNSHKELDVYRIAFTAAMDIFERTRRFPIEEKYSLTDQIRRSSRSVCANIAEAFNKRRYPKLFVSKLSDAEAEAAETAVWLEFARECNYLAPESVLELDRRYTRIVGMIITMMNRPRDWQI